jgi:gliding motility-associated-like protein
VIPGTYTVETCNDAYSLTLGNMTFNKSNPSGPVLLSGAAAQGCDSLVNVQINFKEFTIAESIIYKCDGSNPTLNLNLASHPGPYQISLDGVSLGQVSNLPYTIPIVVGNHVVIVQNQDGCTTSFNVDVEDNNGPNVVLSQVPNADGTVQIITTVTANSIYNLSWSPATTLSCKDCPDPIANPSETTTYTLSYLYGNQCPDQRTITIERINTTVILPDIFSPNGDSNNDRFYVQLPDKVNGIVTSMSIYDRWGNLVFIKKNAPANSPAEGWNGEFGSGEAIQGVYVYLIYVKIEGKAADDVYSGDVTLIR